MSDIRELPRERDLPEDRHEFLRDRVLNGIDASTDRRRSRTWRPARLVPVVAVAAVAVLAGILSVMGIVPGSGAPEAIALGDGALPQKIRDGGNACLTHAREIDMLPPDVRPTMVNYAEHPWLAVVVYRTEGAMFYCTVNPGATGEGGTFGSLGNMRVSTSLSGPITADLMVTQGLDGEYMAVAGRVSARVGRVVFDDGAGHTRDARLANGTFAVAGDYATRETAVLVTYDHAGKEIDRRRAFGTNCDPTYQGERMELPGTVCGPAEQWTQQLPQVSRD